MRDDYQFFLERSQDDEPGPRRRLLPGVVAIVVFLVVLWLGIRGLPW